MQLTMGPRVRKFALTVHVTAAIGWMGAVVAYLALVIAAMNRADAQTLRAAWVAMSLIGWIALVPLSIAALVTGLMMSLGTKWGLFQHYWVVISLALTIVATAILLQHMRLVTFFARVATDMNGADDGRLRGALVGELLHAGLGLLVLLAIQILNVYKPRGLTPYGERKQRDARAV